MIRSEDFIIKDRQQGFTPVELLIVVAIIGIAATIAIPIMMDAWDTARQKRTMVDLHELAIALKSYQVDRNFYPFGAEGYVTPQSYVYRAINIYKDLSPLNCLDGWDNNFYYWPGGNTMATARSYTLGSFGKGAFEDRIVVSMFKCFQCDIRISNGRFFLKPDGPQRDSPTHYCDPEHCR